LSQWSKIKVIIKNVELFRQCCEKHGVGFELNKNSRMIIQGMSVYAVLKDQQGRTGGHDEAYLCIKANEYHLIIDNDPNWCSITARVGQNGGRIMRDYAEATIRNGIRMKGGIVQSATEQRDKSLLLRVMVP